MNQTPLNPDARRAAFEAVQAIDGPASIGSMEIVDVAVSAYLAVAPPAVNSAEELVTTPAGRALANAAFNEGLSAGIMACNDSLDREPFVKPVSPYRPEVNDV